MGMFLPVENSFLEGHLSALILLLPQCVLTGYILFCVNRWMQKGRSKPNTIVLASRLHLALLKTHTDCQGGRV